MSNSSAGDYDDDDDDDEAGWRFSCSRRPRCCRCRRCGWSLLVAAERVEWSPATPYDKDASSRW